MEETQQKRFPWVAVIIIVAAVLVGAQWLQTSSRGDVDGSKTAAPDVINNEGNGQSQTVPATTTTNQPTKNFMNTVTIETNKGTIVFETYDADAPKAAGNFVALAKKGYYDGVIFHRVIAGFMIQGGDPTGTGRGGESAWGGRFEDELNPDTESYKAGYVRGAVAMANAGPDTNGSQFFIMHKDYPLPHNYTIFGRVVNGIEVVDAIANSQTGEADRPVTDIVMKKVTVTEKK